jgi:glutathione synthase/RimK-type ligase-like ATP-grasp enzyme
MHYAMSSYITENRAVLEAVHRACDKYSIQCDTFSGDWLLRLRRDGQTQFIFAYNFGCNSQASDNIARDKVATYQLLADNAIPAVPHYLIKSVVDAHVNKPLLDTLFDTNASLVIKRLDGSRGEAISKADSVRAVQRFIDGQNTSSWSASPCLDITREIRVVVFEDKVQLAYEKLEPKVINGLKMYNLNLGAQARKLPVQDIGAETQKVAVQAMQSIGLRMGAVDVITDNEGQLQVLEINSGFSLEHYAALQAENREEVIAFYEQVIVSLFPSADRR